jgi:hypothetical protein
MSILFASNDEAEFPGAIVSTTAGDFRSAYVSRAFQVSSGTSVPTHITLTKIPQAAGDVVWIHFQHRKQHGAINANSDGDCFFELYDTAANKIFDVTFVNGVFSGNLYGTTTATTAIVGNFDGTVLRAIDIKVDITTPNITVEIYDGGVIAFNETVTNNGKLKPAGFVWRSFDVTGLSGTDTQFISELVVADESTISMGLSEMQGASSDATAEKMSSTLATFAGPASSALRALVVHNRGSVRGGVVGNLRNFLRISATDYNGASMGPTAETKSLITVWDTNPNSAVDWDTTDFSGVEVGVESQA